MSITPTFPIEPRSRKCKVPFLLLGRDRGLRRRETKVLVSATERGRGVLRDFRLEHVQPSLIVDLSYSVIDFLLILG
jgi:hypothetical protein